jgi:hypothetical protein
VSDPRRLKPGDVVRISAEPGDWVVRGTLAFDEDGYRWKEHLLDGSTAAGRAPPLAVGRGGRGRPRAGPVGPPARLRPHPRPPRSPRRRRLPPRRARHGALRVHRHDRRPRRRDRRSTPTTCRRAAASGGLSFERYSAGGSWEVSTAASCSPRAARSCTADVLSCWRCLSSTRAPLRCRGGWATTPRRRSPRSS